MTDNRANESLREVIEATASVVGNDFFRTLVQSLVSTLGVTHCFVGELVGEKKDRVRTHALSVNGSLVDNVEYALVGTPCENVVSTRSMWHIPTGMREKAPDLNVESYLGLRITDASGNVIGLVSVMHGEPMLDSHIGAWVLTNLAARAGAEMERMQVSSQLHEMASFAEMNPSPVLRIDMEGTILLVNRAARALFPEQSLVGQSWLSLCPGMDRSTFDVWLNSGEDTIQQEAQIGDACYLFTNRYDELGRCIHIYGMEITERRRGEKVVENIAKGVSAATGEAFFKSLVRYLCEILGVEYAFVGELMPSVDETIGTIAVHAHGKIVENFTYVLANTPCENVVGKQLRCYPRHVRQEFPLDHLLDQMGIESYVGAPLFDSHGQALGLLVVMGCQPLQNERFTVSMLRIFADRAAAELERKRQEAEILHLKDQLVAENVYLQEEIAASYPTDQMIGKSPVIQGIKRQIALVAPTDSTVLIQGETGTGKELIARAIHAQSRRKDRPLITVNCATIPRELIESELFGHARGAFTGATASRIGRFELANGGTILLDEVTELPIEMQSKLLRVLQEREFERVGESNPIRIDTRFIAASNIPFEEQMVSGRFRADLFYRLNVFPIHVPPLRERDEDVPELVTHFVQRFNVQMNKRVRNIDPSTMNRLRSYSWPGNIRELENVIERAMILAQTPTLTVEDGMVGQPTAVTVEAVPTRTWKAHETSYLRGVIKQTAGVIHGPKGAAAVLGINPSTLRSRLKRLGIYPKKNGDSGGSLKTVS
ncbi:MAG TPA: GAF domain-containing protein [Nitrospirales bacterium]|nr:GAF domain-containing protein [Nitrospirales bacterium]HIN33984.1 GAF domain-containing protein [Nitrospirales bacterium]